MDSFRFFNTCTVTTVGQDSSVGIATRYRLGGPGFESRWGEEIFRTRPDRLWCPPNLLYDGYRVFPRGKATRAWRFPTPPPPPSRAEFKESVELYISPCGPSWPDVGWSLPLALPFTPSTPVLSETFDYLVLRRRSVQNVKLTSDPHFDRWYRILGHLLPHFVLDHLLFTC
jgi:hypothetical protein